MSTYFFKPPYTLYAPPLSAPAIQRTPRFTLALDDEDGLLSVHDRSYDDCPVITTATNEFRVLMVLKRSLSEVIVLLDTDQGRYYVSPCVVNDTMSVTGVGEPLIETIGWAPRSIWKET